VQRTWVATVSAVIMGLRPGAAAVTNTPTVIHCSVEDETELRCTPDEWLATADRRQAAGIYRVVLDALPVGSPWNDEPAVLDPATDSWAFAPWPGVAFVLPLDD
jgi:hypothetical protein